MDKIKPFFIGQWIREQGAPQSPERPRPASTPRAVSLQVRELSRETGLPAHVVRYYARIGLLCPRRHPDNGYQLFGPQDVTRLRIIRQGQRLGLTLGELSGLIGDAAAGSISCARLRVLLEEHRQRNARELAAVRVRQQRLAAALARLDAAPLTAGDLDALGGLLDRLITARPEA